MCTKRASGNSSNSVLIRAVCGGDLRMMRLGFCSVTRFKNHSSPAFQRRRSSSLKPASVSDPGHCGGSFGKAMVRYGEGKPMLANANSSSCGRSQPVIMLSIGRFAGSRNLSLVSTPSLRRKWLGARHW